VKQFFDALIAMLFAVVSSRFSFFIFFVLSPIFSIFTPSGGLSKFIAFLSTHPSLPRSPARFIFVRIKDHVASASLPLPCPCCARANSRNLMRTRVRLHQVAASSSHGQTLIFGQCKMRQDSPLAFFIVRNQSTPAAPPKLSQFSYVSEHAQTLSQLSYHFSS
jgi:hypothetical protein